MNPTENFDGDSVFFANPELGRRCVGGGGFSNVLICTRVGGFEVFDGLNEGAKCIAGGGYKGPSSIEICGITVFKRTAEQWAAILAAGWKADD